jgi:hypothetical protein
MMKGWILITSILPSSRKSLNSLFFDLLPYQARTYLPTYGTGTCAAFHCFGMKFTEFDLIRASQNENEYIGKWFAMLFLGLYSLYKLCISSCAPIYLWESEFEKLYRLYIWDMISFSIYVRQWKYLLWIEDAMVQEKQMQKNKWR